MKLNRIRDKFFILILAIFIPVIVFEILSISNYKKQIIQSKLDSDIRLSEAISNSFEKYIDNLWTQEDIISTYILNDPDLTHEEISNYLNKIVDKQDTLQNIFWLDKDGIIIAGTNPIMLGKSLRYSEYVTEIREGKNMVLSDLVNGFTDDKPILPIAKAVKQGDNLMGIIVANINVEKMGLQFSNLLFDEGDIFIIIDKNGTIIHCNETPDIFMQKRKINADSPAWKALSGTAIITEKKFFENEGLYRLGYSYPIGETGWALSIASKYDNITANIREKTSETIAMCETLLLLSFLIALLMGDFFVTPIIKLKDTAYSIMNGDYSARTNIEGNDEIAITAQTFDNMAESIEKYDIQKSQFFINLSHELKTPLNVIQASLQLIDKVHSESEYCKKYTKVSEQLSLIKQNCYRLIRTVSSLIDLSKHDNGYLTLKLRNCNIISIIEDITMSIVKFAESRNIEVLFDTDTEEKFMACDPDAIERIMLNLISNALKFTPEGGSIFVSIFDKKDKILISVRDTGIGISNDNLDLIFERFKQIDSTLCRNNEGSGIGLSLVKALVESHDGSIKANSVINKGTEFIIELPVILIEEEVALENDGKEKHHSKIVEKIDLEFSDIYGFK